MKTIDKEMEFFLAEAKKLQPELDRLKKKFSKKLFKTLFKASRACSSKDALNSFVAELVASVVDSIADSTAISIGMLLYSGAAESEEAMSSMLVFVVDKLNEARRKADNRQILPKKFSWIGLDPKTVN